MFVIIKQKFEIVVKNSYFKLSADNITFFILKGFFLEKIDSNIKKNVFYILLIKKKAGIKMVILLVLTIFATISFMANHGKRYIIKIIKTRMILLINIVQLINLIKIQIKMTLIQILIRY